MEPIKDLLRNTAINPQNKDSQQPNSNTINIDTINSWEMSLPEISQKIQNVLGKDVTITPLRPEPQVGDKIHDRCLVLKIAYHGINILLPGDATFKLLERIKDQLGVVHIVLFSHHGSNGAKELELINLIYKEQGKYPLLGIISSRAAGKSKIPRLYPYTEKSRREITFLEGISEMGIPFPEFGPSNYCLNHEITFSENQRDVTVPAVVFDNLPKVLPVFCTGDLLPFQSYCIEINNRVISMKVDGKIWYYHNVDAPEADKTGGFVVLQDGSTYSIWEDIFSYLSELNAVAFTNNYSTRQVILSDLLIKIANQTKFSNDIAEDFQARLQHVLPQDRNCDPAYLDYLVKAGAFAIDTTLFNCGLLDYYLKALYYAPMRNSDDRTSSILLGCIDAIQSSNHITVLESYVRNLISNTDKIDDFIRFLYDNGIIAPASDEEIAVEGAPEQDIASEGAPEQDIASEGAPEQDIASEGATEQERLLSNYDSAKPSVPNKHSSLSFVQKLFNCKCRE